MDLILLILSSLILLVTIVFLLVFFYLGIFSAAPFVPTPMPAVKRLLEHANIKKGNKVYDLGAGDGRFVHLAAKKYGAKAIGFEINVFVYLLAKVRQWLWGWKGTMKRANFLKQDISDADIILCYLLPKSLAQYQEKFQTELKKGTRIFSYAFSIGDWTPIEVIPKEKSISKIMVYEV